MTSTLAYDSPYVRRAPRHSASCRLFCMPYAGAGISAFTPWADLLPDSVELAAIQLPGREDRVNEQPFTEAVPLVHTLVQVMRPYVRAPFALFGHSGGALLAFEVARALCLLDAQPDLLIISGEAAPNRRGRNSPIHELPDAEFRERVAELDGTSPHVLKNDELMDVLLPTLRADFTLWETYRFADGEPLACRVVAFAGREDPHVSVDDVQEWAKHTRAEFCLRLFDGSHFFLNQSHDVVTAIGEELSG